MALCFDDLKLFCCESAYVPGLWQATWMGTLDGVNYGNSFDYRPMLGGLYVALPNGTLITHIELFVLVAQDADGVLMAATQA